MFSSVSFFNSLFWAVFPPTRAFKLKRAMLRLAGAKVGRNVRCVSSVRTYVGGLLTIGDEVWIGHSTLFIGGDASITIGDNCDIAPQVTFATGTHKIEQTGFKVAGDGYSLPISVGDGCWIGVRATILGGTTIGPRSIVAAGSVVRGIFPSDSLIGGVPARIIKSLREVSSVDENY